MTTMQRTTPVQTGWDVYGSDGEHLGSVAEVGRNYLRVEKGLLFKKDIYIPVSAITKVNDAEETVLLNAPKHRVESMGWDMPPTSGSWDDWSQGGTGTDKKRMTLHEEELDARKTSHKAGEVEVRKDVVQEHKTIDVPVTREEVHVRQVATDRAAKPGEATFAEGQTIRVPVTEEEVEVTKRPRVTGEVEVEKVARGETVRTGDTVRKEKVDVSGDGLHRRA